MNIIILLAFFFSTQAISNSNTIVLSKTHNGITQASLENGLKIIIKIDNRAPVFISQLWYKVGASDETSPNTGISHMLEHMMFKGTQKYPVGEFSQIIAKNGGAENAFTSKDYTAYYQKMHKSKLELAIQMEADRMRNLTFSDDELKKERQVVIEERRMRIEDNPNAKVFEQLHLISYGKSGAYYAPIIGFQADIEAYKLQDLKDWYEKYYAPNNATLVVVGDVDPQQVINYAQQYFAEYDFNPQINKLKNKPPIALTQQNKQLKLKAKLPLYTMAFHVPSLGSAKDKSQAYQLEMLAYVLDNGLSKTLIRNQQIASDISVSYRLYDKYQTQFNISFVASKGIENTTIINVIKQQVAELIKHPELLKDEVKRTKAQLEASFVFEQDQISTQSYYLGMLQTVGLGVNEMFEYVNKMNKVASKELSNVAKVYLNFNQMNTVELLPQKIQ
jgi:zinc protease